MVKQEGGGVATLTLPLVPGWCGPRHARSLVVRLLGLAARKAGVTVTADSVGWWFVNGLAVKCKKVGSTRGAWLAVSMRPGATGEHGMAHAR